MFICMLVSCCVVLVFSVTLAYSQTGYIYLSVVIVINTQIESSDNTWCKVGIVLAFASLTLSDTLRRSFGFSVDVGKKICPYFSQNHFAYAQNSELSIGV